MGLKHRIKSGLRGLYARALWGSGLHRLVDRLSRPRLLVLYGHCVAQPATNGSLDADMKISGGRLGEILGALGRRVWRDWPLTFFGDQTLLRATPPSVLFIVAA